MRIRPATPTDLGLLPGIEVAAGVLFREIGMDDIADDDPPTIEELEAAAAILVAAIDGTLVGYAWIELVDDQAHLEQLSVLPEHGGRGIGTALLEAVCEWARARGDDGVTLTAFRDVAFNAPLYAKRGFAELHEADWSPGIRTLIAEEAAHGLDPTQRVVMRRPVSGAAPPPPA
ncbi:MAG: GNAT family N-acetyltransferase [Acidimicrobiales bacterium]